MLLPVSRYVDGEMMGSIPHRARLLEHVFGLVDLAGDEWRASPVWVIDDHDLAMCFLEFFARHAAPLPVTPQLSSASGPTSQNERSIKRQLTAARE